MPLNKKGKKIKRAMVKQYGKKKGESVFYAMENSGKLKKVLKAKGGMDASQADFGGGSTTSGGNGRDPSKQYTGKKTNLSPKARQALQDQRTRARGRISPSTTPTGKAIAAGLGIVTGMPFLGYQVGKRMVDKSSMAFGVPKSTKTKQTTVDTSRDSNDRGDNITVKKSPIISGPVKTLDPVETKPLVSPSGAFNYSVGFKRGGILKQGKPKLAKKGWK